MKKEQFIARVAEVSGKTKKETVEFEKAFEQVIAEIMETGDKLVLTGFLTVEGVEVEASKARNPKTGEEIEVPAHVKAKAKVADSLRKAIKEKTAK